MNCDEIYLTVDAVFNAYDNHPDQLINLMDYIDNLDFYEFYVHNCDADFDGSLTRCEMFDCFMEAENEMRNT